MYACMYVYITANIEILLSFVSLVDLLVGAHLSSSAVLFR